MVIAGLSKRESDTMEFIEYYSDEIEEWITTKAIHNIHRDILESDSHSLNEHIDEYNKRIANDSSYRGYHGATVIRKSIHYRQHQLRSIQESFDQPCFDISALSFDIFGFIASTFMAFKVGGYIGNEIGRALGGADLDEVDRLMKQR